MKAFLDDGGAELLRGAVRAVEARSSAEVVVSVRPRAGSYAAIDLGWALLAGVAMLAVGLFSPYEFSSLALFLEPLFAGLVFFVVSRSVPAMRRLAVPAGRRAERVARAAAAQFHEKRVHQTSGRTGLLIHVSLLERTCEVVADIGVQEAVDAEAWEAAVVGLRGALARGCSAATFAGLVRGLGDLLEPALPRAEDDVNELPDEPCA